MSIEKLKYEDTFMMEKLMDKINEIIDEIDDIKAGQNRIWKFLRMKEQRGQENAK